jgi:hypothetical protein
VTLTEDQQKAYDVYMAAIEKYTALINHFNISDETVTGIITQEAADFFNGSKTAEETAGIIQNKVDLYINE